MTQVDAANFLRFVSRLVQSVAPVQRVLVVVTTALLCGHLLTSVYAAADTATQSLPRPAL